jgi:protein SCO1
MNRLRRAIAGCLLGVALVPAVAARAAATAPTAELPGDSLYQLDVALDDQDGRAFRLADRRGRPLLLAMFYATCTYACPALVDTVKLLERGLARSSRVPIDVLLVTFDPERDDARALGRLVAERHLDAAYWTLARPSSRDARRLAALLGVQYRRQPDGGFNHTTEIVLLDVEGRVVARTAQLGAVDDAFLRHAARCASARQRR